MGIVEAYRGQGVFPKVPGMDLQLFAGKAVPERQNDRLPTVKTLVNLLSQVGHAVKKIGKNGLNPRLVENGFGQNENFAQTLYRGRDGEPVGVNFFTVFIGSPGAALVQIFRRVDGEVESTVEIGYVSDNKLVTVTVFRGGTSGISAVIRRNEKRNIAEILQDKKFTPGDIEELRGVMGEIKRDINDLHNMAA